MPIAFSQVVLATPLDDVDAAINAAEYSRALDLINAGLDGKPDDYALRFRRAEVNHYLGKHALAIDDLDLLREEFPRDVDYAFARARSLAAIGRTTAALDDLREATALAPAYEDVWRLRHALLVRQPGDEYQAELDQLLLQASGRFPQATWWQDRIPKKQASWSALLGYGYDSLDNDNPSWHQQFVEINRSHPTAGNYRVGIARDERYGESDLSIRVGGDRSFSTDWFGAIDISLVANPRFQADFGYSLSIGRALDDGWVGSLGYRRRDYDAVAVDTVSGDVEKYVGNFRAAYSLFVSSLSGASNSLGHSASVSWYADDDTSFSISIGAGEEAEAIGPGRVLETDVRSLTLSGVRQLNDRFGLRWWLGLHEQGDFYRRRSLGLAVSIQL